MLRNTNGPTLPNKKKIPAELESRIRRDCWEIPRRRKQPPSLSAVRTRSTRWGSRLWWFSPHTEADVDTTGWKNTEASQRLWQHRKRPQIEANTTQKQKRLSENECSQTVPGTNWLDWHCVERLNFLRVLRTNFLQALRRLRKGQYTTFCHYNRYLANSVKASGYSVSSSNFHQTSSDSIALSRSSLLLIFSRFLRASTDTLKQTKNPQRPEHDSIWHTWRLERESDATNTCWVWDLHLLKLMISSPWIFSHPEEIRTKSFWENSYWCPVEAETDKPLSTVNIFSVWTCDLFLCKQKGFQKL